jgi:ABC-2 type transport system permease protein
VAGANVLLFAILAAGLPPSLDRLSTAGSVAFASSLVGVGLVFAGVAVLVCQLTASARSAIGIASGVVGIACLVRAVGDMRESVLPWFSPFGWATEMRAYVDERWWPLAVSALTTALLTMAAMRINARRDVGAGIIASRRGAPTAARGLGSPFGLALRLQRTSLLAWSVCLFLVGVLYGGIAKEAGRLYEDIDALQDYLTRMGAADPVAQFLAPVGVRLGADRVRVRHPIHVAPSHGGGRPASRASPFHRRRARSLDP